MSSTSPHIIYRLALRLHLVGAADGRAVQQRAEQELQSRRLLNALDEVLSEVGRPGEWVELDRLEVDLGTLQSAVMERQLADRLPALLRLKLREAIADARLQGTAVWTAQMNDFEQLIYFLTNGVLPSSAAGLPSMRQWEPQLVALVGALSPAQQASLQQTLTLPRARQRLINQFSVLLWLAIGAALGAAPQLRQLAEQLLQLRQLPYEDAAEPLDSLIWERIIQRLSHSVPIDWSALLTQLAAVNDAAESRNLDAARSLLAEVLAPENLGDAKAAATAPRRAASPEDALSDAVQFVENAGVVLLHPFLAACFAACGWLADDEFRSKTAQMQAVRLVHFLATGNSQAAEYELLLPKLLCGVPAAAPQNARVRLPRQAREEGTELLKAAINHWPALKNTSPTGLREGFLQREGKLEHAPDGSWTLTVEQKAQDVLLDQLPYGWGLGVVQLPWMPKRLMVSWG
ncbi:contractile injection system tape measure protein [Hymenobacter cavernae]|uniref:Uncharacterized protein n=1 Tax=Hymenobacter cavernae TaxID=2044852 RepID=A0ABQ1USG7_9BACT|nr:contractile injection system tape measure protein [Hymenobacter cavernae]GGF24374.1 hypothetical protein GCM10011383_40020 [Hymenobacter cavernae]